MTSVALARAKSLRRFTDLEYILIGDLRELLEAPIDDQNLRWISAVLDSLLETLPRRFELKQEGGYLHEVLDAHPNWECHVRSLKGEHRQMCVRLRQLRDQLPDAARIELISGTLQLELKAWMQSFVSHNRREARLLQTAMNLEIGVGD